jgi:hypothetical protein
MMPIISVANLQAYTDKLAASWELLKVPVGVATGNPVAGTHRNLMALLLAIPVNSGDVDVEADLNTVSQTVQAVANVAGTLGQLQPILGQLNNHCSYKGPALNASISSLASYLSYLNGGPGGGAVFSALVHPSFADLYSALIKTNMPPAGLLSRAISPLADATSYPSGMGTVGVGVAYAAGAAVPTTYSAEVNVVAVVTTNFAGGTALPTLAIAGVDHTGATGTTWTPTFDGNNPASALAGVTITPAILAQARQVVAASSISGIVAGSILVVNSGLPDQETIYVEAAGGGNITAVFQRAHGAGATLSGARTYACVPSVGGRRCRSVTGLTLGVTGHSAGALRVDGVQDRVPV